jgi:hypothetical protein
MCRRWFSRDDEKNAARDAARMQREAAEEARAAAQSERASMKEEDIMGAVARRKPSSRGMSSGSGRRSLFTTSGGGFLGRFK